jgi:hypothetical protein
MEKVENKEERRVKEKNRFGRGGKKGYDSIFA